MRQKPIYVELDMKTTLPELWEHTQNPQLHERWDLRFSEIRYLPRTGAQEPQSFQYKTRIGFGLSVAGTGKTFTPRLQKTSEKLSVLAFDSKQPISLIREGSGFWKYVQNGSGISFLTVFDYRTRFGLAGRLLDRLVFRPLFGYATAWSFDRLRIWLEHRIPPAVIAERALVHYACVLALALLWCYQGLVPKLMFPEAGELTLLRRVSWIGGNELGMLRLLGCAEIVIGILSAFLHRSGLMAALQAAALLLLTLPALLFAPELLRAPFNPVTLAVPMLGFIAIARLTCRHLPDAGRCKRKPEKRKKGGIPHGIDLRADARSGLR
ncbi:DoxX-like family protein [Paenibacillus sp. N4]|uniref:DoxX-like family protein n=1 Tax=Paenibacillus vietnamensis TaxID=2590547 RepID=UPI001CD0A251|nr:DoxX-like family protein [Paenibacillus vietnamensis]MCA0758011.1 DoxX-like family protein [Paenibacillus vietnamensis]